MGTETIVRIVGALFAVGVAVVPLAVGSADPAPSRPTSASADNGADTAPDMVAMLGDRTVGTDGITTYRFEIRNDGEPSSVDIRVAWWYRTRSRDGAEAMESGAETFGRLVRNELRAVEVVCRPDDDARCITAGIDIAPVRDEIAVGNNHAEFPIDEP